MATIWTNLGVSMACHLYGQRVVNRKGTNNLHRCEYSNMSISNVFTLPLWLVSVFEIAGLLGQRE